MPALADNFDVDYVISYRFGSVEKEDAVSGFEKLVRALRSVGLESEVRNGENYSILVFVRVASDQRFAQLVYRSRVRDWLYGIRLSQPDKDYQKALTVEPLTEAERYRIAYQMITGPRNEGGAAITPKEGKWKNVENIFLLHDRKYNKEWLKKWSMSTFLTAEDIDQIRDRFGEKIAFYFAFTQYYFAALFFPAIFGFSSWLLLGNFSAVYGVVNALWTVIFVEYWKRQQQDLSIRWGTKGVSAIQEKRKEFVHENEVTDPVTGERIKTFSVTKRLQRQLLQVPFTLMATIALGTIIATCFGIEIFISEVYQGPLKGILVFLPTGLLTTMVPTISTLLTAVATRLNQYENYETTDGYETALTQKIFVLNFITSYLPILLTAFIYVPFASTIVPYLDIFSLTVRPFAENEKQMHSPKAGFQINPNRLKKQVIYFTVTAQIVNFAMETIVPYLKTRGSRKYHEIASRRAHRRGDSTPVDIDDLPDERAFLKRVRNEVQLAQYDVTEDLREMCVQFGYLSLFSVVWPLTAVSFLVNNWVELRSDAAKICISMQRPIPVRADSIGPWLDSISFLSWFGSITTAALVYMFSNGGIGPGGTISSIKGWALLLSIFFSEHIYLLTKKLVALVISKIDSEATLQQRAEEYIMRKRFLEAIGGPEWAEGSETSEVSEPEENEEKLHERLEDAARRSSVHDARPGMRFWQRQHGVHEVVNAATTMMQTAREKKRQ